MPTNRLDSLPTGRNDDGFTLIELMVVIVLVGLLGKVFGPLGFLIAVLRGRFPLAFGATLLTNDLIWWLPFVLILRDAWTHRPTDEGDA